MGTQVIVILFTFIAFFAMILQLALNPKYAAKMMGGMLIVSVVGGIFFYGYGYAVTIPNPVMAFIRALLAVCGMFVGKNELAQISAAPLFQYPGMVLAFWLIHLLALYTSASAAITTIGKEMLKKITQIFALAGDLAIIYGTSERALSLGKECRNEKAAVVFVDENVDSNTVLNISKMGANLRSDYSALHPDKRFLESLRMVLGRRKMCLYAIRDNEEENRLYSIKMQSALEEAGVDPELTSIVVLGDEEALAPVLQVLEDENGEMKQYGYGHVSVINQLDLVARVMIQNCPPWNCLTFDENGRAEEDFDALIIGFGQTGQATLKQLVMNGQYEGSRFHAAVIAPDCLKSSGYIRQICNDIFLRYDIDLIQADGNGIQTFEYLYERRKTLKYIAICVGNERLSREITDQIVRYLRYISASAQVVQCLHNSVVVSNLEGGADTRFMVYEKKNLDGLKIDQMAMALNHSYTGNTDATPWEDWKRCDYFSRMSARASVDYIPALLYAAHTTAEKVVAEGWKLSKKQIENLSRSEHLRWCAFHYAMGFQPMSEREFEARKEQYLDEVRSSGKSRIRIAKNMAGRTHACLIPWEELEVLSEKENAITGGHRDYQQEDVKNVLAIENLLRTGKTNEE